MQTLVELQPTDSPAGDFHDEHGIEIQTYCAIIACMLISLWTGRKPTLQSSLQVLGDGLRLHLAVGGTRRRRRQLRLTDDSPSPTSLLEHTAGGSETTLPRLRACHRRLSGINPGRSIWTT